MGRRDLGICSLGPIARIGVDLRRAKCKFIDGFAFISEFGLLAFSDPRSLFFLSAALEHRHVCPAGLSPWCVVGLEDTARQQKVEQVFIYGGV